MKTKALVLAVPKGQFSGPVVPLRDGKRWRVDADGRFEGRLNLLGGNGRSSLPLTHEMVIEDVDQVQVEVEVLEGVLTVEAICVG